MDQGLVIEVVPHLALVAKAKTFQNTGVVIQHQDYVFLKIDDAFIHDLYEDLKLFKGVEKPDYFTDPKTVGAHITILYPEENTMLKAEDLGQFHSFQVKDLCKAHWGGKEYFVLAVEAPTLSALRETYHLSPEPQFLQQNINFHITIGVRAL